MDLVINSDMHGVSRPVRTAIYLTEEILPVCVVLKADNVPTTNV